MKNVFFNGESDDLVHVEGFGGLYHEVDCYGSGVHLATFNVRAGDEGVAVHALYDGSWGFALTSLNEADDFRSLPAWPFKRSFGDRCAYSETLKLVVPDDATIERVVQQGELH